MRRTTSMGAVLVALVLGVVACGSPNPRLEGRGGPSTTLTATESTIAAFACNDRRTGAGGGFGTLADVRFGAHDGYDRITFEFAGAIPAYEIKPATPPLHLDPSDKLLTLDGDVFLDVVFRGASAGYTFDGAGNQVLVQYAGPVRVEPHLVVLREAAVRGDFEGVLIWTLGASTSTCLRVLELQSPPRLVIDLSHPPA